MTFSHPCSCGFLLQWEESQQGETLVCGQCGLVVVLPSFHGENPIPLASRQILRTFLVSHRLLNASAAVVFFGVWFLGFSCGIPSLSLIPAIMSFGLAVALVFMCVPGSSTAGILAALDWRRTGLPTLEDNLPGAILAAWLGLGIGAARGVIVTGLESSSFALTVPAGLLAVAIGGGAATAGFLAGQRVRLTRRKLRFMVLGLVVGAAPTALTIVYVVLSDPAAFLSRALHDYILLAGGACAGGWLASQMSAARTSP